MPIVIIADIEIYYSFAGAGERLLLFPDNHLSSRAHQDEIDFFAKRFEVVAFDFPTTGRSTHEVMYPDERQVLDGDTRCLRRLADRGGYTVPDQILNAIGCPTLLTGHLSDPALPGLAGEYARISSLISDCSLYLSARANHPYLERPFMWTDPESFRTVVGLLLNKIS